MVLDFFRGGGDAQLEQIETQALGEWLSVQSSRELYQRQIDIERREVSDARRCLIDDGGGAAGRFVS
jgi:hypothetical protein